jgi:hypothetical protein
MKTPFGSFGIQQATFRVNLNKKVLFNNKSRTDKIMIAFGKLSLFYTFFIQIEKFFLLKVF